MPILDLASSNNAQCLFPTTIIDNKPPPPHHCRCQQPPPPTTISNCSRPPTMTTTTWPCHLTSRTSTHLATWHVNDAMSMDTMHSHTDTTTRCAPPPLSIATTHRHHRPPTMTTADTKHNETHAGDNVATCHVVQMVTMLAIITVHICRWVVVFPSPSPLHTILQGPHRHG